MKATGSFRFGFKVSSHHVPGQKWGFAWEIWSFDCKTKHGQAYFDQNMCLCSFIKGRDKLDVAAAFLVMQVQPFRNTIPEILDWIYTTYLTKIYLIEGGLHKFSMLALHINKIIKKSCQSV